MKLKDDLNYEKIQQSASYRQLRDIILREVNYQVAPFKTSAANLFAPLSFAEPRRVQNVDYKVFKKTEIEKGQLYIMKKAYRKIMKEKYSEWIKKKSTKTKYLSINDKFTT